MRSLANTQTRRRRPSSTFTRVALLLVVLAACSRRCCGETEVNYVPNEEAERKNGPSLPMSMKQRQQLLQLEQAISQSPDPQGTLQQVASANQMSAQDLFQMLQKNAQDLQQDPELMKKVASGLSPRNVPAAIARTVASAGVAVAGLARARPRAFATVLLSLLFVLYASFVAVPRTGFVLSSGSKPLGLSSGPTTAFRPPAGYLHRIAESGWMSKRKVSSAVSKRLKTDWEDMEAGDVEVSGIDQVLVNKHKLGWKNELKQAVTATVALPAVDMLEQFGDEDSEEQRDFVLNLMYEQAQSVISSLDWTEFVDENESFMHMIPSKDMDRAVLAIKGLGDWGRYGLIYWKHQEASESPHETSLTLSTLKGTALDAQLRVSVSWEDDDDKLVLRVHLVSPRGGRTASARQASRIAQTLASSVARSVTTRARQKLVRASQSGRVQQLARRRALERRAIRFEALQKMEEMAEDRRRKWQRNNPDAGRYRPSGVRQQSPNNC